MKDTHSEKLLQRWEFQKGAVQRTLERFRKTDSYFSRPKSGRPRSTTKQEDQFIKLTSLHNRKATAGDIQLTINNTREQPSAKQQSGEDWLHVASEEEWHVQNHFCVLPISASGIYGKKVQKLHLGKLEKSTFH